MHLGTLIAASATLVAVLLALVTSSAPHASGGGLVAAYAFDEGAGTIVRDSSSQGNVGTALDTTWSESGRFGGALVLNGSSSWVTVPDSASLDLTKNFTIEAWVKPAADMGTAWQTIAVKEGVGDLVYGLFANSDTSTPAASVSPPNGSADARGLAPLPANVWTHVATTWDGSTLRVFVNGTQVSTRAVSGTLQVSTGALRIGGNAVRGERFSGELDDLRIYGQSLSASKISNDMTTAVTPPSGPPPPPPSDITPPSTPTALAASNVAANVITTTWTASTDNVGVTGYNLFRDGSSAGSTVAPVFTFAGLSCGTSYVLGVEAFDAAGNTSGRQSMTVSTLDCPDTSSPSLPSGFAAGATGTDSITTSWAPSTDNVGVAGYTLYRDGVSDGTTTGELFTFAGLSCGTNYVLGIEAFDAAGNVSASQSIIAPTAPCPDLTAPSAPTSFAAGPTGTTSIATSWMASTDNVGVTGYTLYRDGASVGTTTATSFSFAGLTCGVSHVLGVEAFDAAGNVSARTTITVSTAVCAPDTTRPSAPTGFVLTTAGKTSVVMSWTGSTDNVGVAGYTLYRSGVSQGKTTATSFTYVGMSCSGAYTLGVEAFDAAGNVSARTSVTVLTTPCPDAIAPSAPRGLVAASVGTTSIALSWTASTDNVGVTGYAVFVDGVSAGTTTTSFTVDALACGTSHVLGVQAFDAAGNISPRTSAAMSTAPCPDLTAPSAPALFTAGTTGVTSIATSWAASTDNAGVAGYTLVLDGATVGTTTAVSFTFAGLSCGTSYVLGVEAFDAAGNVSPRAAVSASTPACPDTTPPTAPASFAAGATAPTSISTSWAPSADDVGVAGYTAYRDGTSVAIISGASVATVPTVNFTFAGLSCGTSYVLAVEAFDAAGNVSVRQSVSASTTACADTTPPQVAVTAPAAAATVSGAVRLAATATDPGGIASVQFAVDGVNAGAAVTSAPYAFTWDSVGVTNGAHTIAARAIDIAGNSAISAGVTVMVQNALDTTNAFKKVDIGPGFMDAALHSVIRTASGRVYVFAADDTPQRKGTGPGVIHAYRADQLGIRTSFTEVDAAHRPSATGNTHVVGSPDVRLASNGVAHMVYTDETNATLWYETFSTATDTWGARQSLATGVDIPAVAIKRETSNALVLDANDVPHVAYAGGGVVQYRNRVGGTWSAPTTVSSGGTPVHVGLAAAPDGTIDLSWLQGAVAPSSILFAQRSSVGTWSTPETVASGDVLDNTNADQGPSVAYSASGEPYVLYVSAKPASAVRVRRRNGGAWTLDPTPGDFFTHTPQIYMQGNDLYAFLGHDVQIRFAYAYHLPGQAWSTLTALTSTLDGTLDGSASVRWDPLHETNAGVIDATFFDEDQLNNKTYFPEAYYMAVLPSGTGGGGTPQPPSDTTAPTVSLTAPAPGATVSAAVTVSANAADNVAVAGVQFKLDGANLGVEETAAPYSINWDSSTVANGTHTLTAVARDAAGNTTTAASLTVTTSNASAPPPPAAGTVLVGNAATESKVDSDGAGQAEAFKATAAVTGSVMRVRVFLDAGSTAGRVIVGLYTNNAAGHPGTLLTSGTITVPAAGQNNEVAVSAAPVTAGQTYWLAVLGTTGTIAFRDRGVVGAGSAEASQQTTLTALPATWTSGASFTDGLISAVAIG